MFFVEIFSRLSASPLVKLLVLAVALDMILGVLRAAKERKLNSTIGINGAIRKAGMLLCVAFFAAADMVMSINVIGFLPQEALTVLQPFGLDSIGICDLFALVFLMCELLSVLKNMLRAGVPLPAGIYDKLHDFVAQFTDELGEIKE